MQNTTYGHNMLGTAYEYDDSGGVGLSTDVCWTLTTGSRQFLT